MSETRVKVSSIVQSQLPAFVREDYPLAAEFLSEYYKSLENKGGPSDIIQNIDKYVQVDALTNLVDSTTLSSGITTSSSTISVDSTAGFTTSYGLLKIGSEVITYTGITTNSFTGCIRGFSGITSYHDPTTSDKLVFSSTSAATHDSGDTVVNLSNLFLKEFYKKVKKQIVPGFDDRNLYSGLNKSLFIKQSKDFYSSKGTDQSVKILFKALYGEEVDVIKPKDFLIKPSSADYAVNRQLVVEKITGDIEDLENRTIFQDQIGSINAASASISKVERILRGNNEYYVLSIDDSDGLTTPGVIKGTFTIHPRTLLSESVSSGDSSISVDSTVGFPNSGTLIIGSLTVTYTSKSLTQFFGCSGISRNFSSGEEVRINAYAYGTTSTGTATFRVTGVLSDSNIIGQSIGYEKGQKIKINSLGYNSSDYNQNNWFFNVPVSYDVESLELVDESDFTYAVYFYESNNLLLGDSVTFVSSSGAEFTGSVVAYNTSTSIKVNGQGELNVNGTYTLRKNLLKVDAQNYSSLSNYNSNVQNVYVDLDDESFYVTSPSIPTYLNQSLNVSNGSATFSGSFSSDTELVIGQHSFLTGDSVVYKPISGSNTLGISTSVYFIQKVNDTTVRLANSPSNISSGKFLSLTGDVTNNQFKFTKFTYGSGLDDRTLSPQKIIRKISTPEKSLTKSKTTSGTVGIFINGVEIANYKSKDFVHFGEIESIVVSSGGQNYDVINPPVLNISDPVGSGSSVFCSVVGELKRIDILDPGFDYLSEPIIKISGGNGKNASAKVNLVQFEHSATFISSSFSTNVDLTNDTIGFSTYHKFANGEEIIYSTQSGVNVGGLTTGAKYFVSVSTASSVRLHNNFKDAVSGINTINLTSYGSGNHILKSVKKKNKIGSISIENSGSGYTNRKITTTTSGINTASNTINVENHGYQSGEIVSYSTTGTVVGGLSETSYYVTKVDDNNFRLSAVSTGSVGVNTGSQDFFYNTKQYVNLTSTGSGTHIFNYPPITATVVGTVGVTTFAGQDFSAKIQPVFRGSVDSVFVEDGGSSYGSEEIINYNPQPQFTTQSGSGAQVTPVISNGKILKVVVNLEGSGYNSIPDLVISGSGTGAVLTPVITNEKLTEVRVISGGTLYGDDTSIKVVAAGSGANFESVTKTWNVNLVEKNIFTNQITDDDGFLTKSFYNDSELQYCHAYAPRKLRSLVVSTNNVEDLRLVNGLESSSIYHSPILGWAYDGNPIYGPYGYSTPTGGAVKALTSGYKISLASGRPSTSIYPEGFFVEDYVIDETGDLDEHNGRFCITPEYPNGTYAYFTTISTTSVESEAPFQNYFKPAFPYVIGNTYYSNPIAFNFSRNSNQDDIDINETQWLRNTTPYNLNSVYSSYDYLFNPNKIRQSGATITSINSGNVSSIGIVTGGKQYKVGDVINFDNSKSDGLGVSAKVSLIGGKSISQISVASSTIDSVEFYPLNQPFTFVGFATQTHNLINNDLVSITGKFDYKQSGNITVKPNTLVAITSLASTVSSGLVTYFSVSGNLDFPNIKENDIYQVGNEEIKILNIDKKSSRVRVLRNLTDVSGIQTYSSGIALTEKSRKFQIIAGLTTSYNFNVNKELYFDPTESVGLGTTAGVGIGSTLTFSNPGVGLTQVTIPTRTIYLPDHQLNTGTELIYDTNGGTGLSISTDGVANYTLSDNSIVYTAKITKDLIGISTVKVGLGSTGEFVGLGTTNGVLMYFHSVGTGNTHSFTTNYQNIFSASVSKNVVTVSTSSTHGLTTGDNVVVDVKTGVTTTFNVKYDAYNRRCVINPRSFTASDIDVINDIITVEKHGFYDGQKVIHTAASPAGGLTNNTIYYIVVISENKLKLTTSKYDSKQISPLSIVDLTSTSSGTLSPINPPIKVIKNSVVVFDLSDSSLAYVKSGVSYPAFELNIYSDPQFSNKFDSSKSTTSFEVSKTGNAGVDANAKTTLSFNDDISGFLYYRLDPINLDDNTDVNKEIVVDYETDNNNKIVTQNSLYSGNYSVIVGVSTVQFQYNVAQTPERSSYSSSEVTLDYTVSSGLAFGPIKDIKLQNKGINYKKLPFIKSITSGIGTDAVLEVNSENIGAIQKTSIDDIGFDYSSDFSVRPSALLPYSLKVDNLSSIDSIGVTSSGRNYTVSPDLVFIDGSTNEVNPEVKLNYSVDDFTVTVIQNSKGISNIKPIIIPTNNVNGVGVTLVSYNSSEQKVVVSLGQSFSDLASFPFNVGERVLLENVSVGVGSTGYGFNSEDYGYKLFEVSEVTPNIGGIGATVAYSLSNILPSGQLPGVFDEANSTSAKLVPESNFPIFNVTLKKNNFLKGNALIPSGKIEGWDPDSNILTVNVSNNLEVGDIIKSISGSEARILDISTKLTIFDVGESSVVKKSWTNNVGFLNDTLQKIPDNDYYQNFSYSIKSPVDYEDWDEVVDNLTHTSGFKKFGDLVITTSSNGVAITTSQDSGDFSSLVDLQDVVDLNCYQDFDLVSENNINVGGKIKSDEISFSSRTLQDTVQSVGNRVLEIDNISSQFDTNPRATRYSSVDTFDLSDFRSRKYVYFAIDRLNDTEREIGLLSLVHNDTQGFLNHYGAVYTASNVGTFDLNVSGSIGNLLFYPNKYAKNDYGIGLISYDIKETTGIGSTSLGEVVSIASSSITIASGISSATTIVGIDTTYRASKILVQIAATDDSYFEFNELTVLHDGTNVELLEYFPMATDDLSLGGSVGLGTYIPSISGSQVNIDFKPNASLGVGHTINTVRVSIADTSLSGVGTITTRDSRFDSHSTLIASSGSPTAVGIASFDNNDGYYGAYYFVSVEDLTNQEYEVTEIVTVTDGTTPSISDFGTVNTFSSLSGLGTFDVVTNGTTTELQYTPNQNIEVSVRVYQNIVGNNDILDINNELNLNNVEVTSTSGQYTGTENDLKKDFQLTHNGYPIFQNIFDSTNSSVVDLTNNQIIVSNHFFVTGEEVTYSYPGFSTSTVNAIGIATTTITGIGLTDKLPTTLYIVKDSDTKIRVSASASEALLKTPTVLDLISVGVGTQHTLTSNKRVERTILTIDNMINEPLSGVGITYTLTSNVGFDYIDMSLNLSGISTLSAGDYVQVDDEIMLVEFISDSSNSISVSRAQFGTGIATHTSGSLLKKLSGDYNISGSTVYFTNAPFGNVPLTDPTQQDELDYTGIQTSSTFGGRVFTKSGIEDGLVDTYYNSYLFDKSIESSFDGVSSDHILISDGLNVSGFSTDNAVILINNILQLPNRTGSISITGGYELEENAGITTISFEPQTTNITSDVNVKNLPRGGIILSVAATEGFGYQPLVAAGGTAVISGLGTVESISIGNSGSGYRSGIQTTVNVGVATTSIGTPNIVSIGTAAISGGNIVSVAITNPGSNYTSDNPPIVIFDSPLPYNNIPLVYSSSSQSGVGTEATADIVVGQGSSVISFELKNLGYAYAINDILTVSIGGTTGIPTDVSVTYDEFQLTVDQTYNDSFSGWSIGNFQVLDEIEDLFDGEKTVFELKIQGVVTSIEAAKGSQIDLKSLLLVFVNDVLQKPGDGYVFNGGSRIVFAEPPNFGDTAKILFYRGNANVDTIDIDILETVKTGDTLRIYDNSYDKSQDKRLVTSIVSANDARTNAYGGPELSQDTTLLRPVVWCKQTTDKIIDGSYVSKDRIWYEPNIQPTTNLIQSVGIGSTQIFVESVKTFFDNNTEYATSPDPNQEKIIIISQDSISGAAATAVVSYAGTISSIVISDGGVGYTTSPTVTILTPVGIGTTQRAEASASISVGGTVSSISITSPGTGYTFTNPPLVLIEIPSVTREYIEDVAYNGDFGIITGIATTSVGVASTGIVFDLFIPEDSFLRDLEINSVGIATTGVSGIQTGYYFTVFNSNVGNGVTSIDEGNNTIGIGSTFIDNIYKVAAVSIAQTACAGFAQTYVAKVTVSLSEYNGVDTAGLGFSGFYGEYSWGLISATTRSEPKSFASYNNGIVGITTSPVVQRYNSLKYQNYTS